MSAYTSVMSDVLIHSRYRAVADELHRQLDADPTYSAQLSVWVRGEQVLDLCGGPDLGDDSLVCLFSVSKGITGICVARLIESGHLDPDAAVRRYWPEFAAAGKAHVTVRQLLSHQAGLPEVDGGLTPEEYWDDRLAAPRLAAQRPAWAPGLAFGYHAITIGILANELFRRILGASVAEYFESEVRAPRELEVYLGLPEHLERRVAPVRFPEFPAPGTGDAGGLADVIARPLLGASGFEAIANTRAGHASGMPAAGAVGSARGIAALYAAVLADVGGPRLFSEQTLGVVGQVQASGVDIASGEPGRYGILFQKPAPFRPFAGYRAIGHDGAAGSLGFADPEFDIAFGFTGNRPAPAGGERRADALAALVRGIAGSS